MKYSPADIQTLLGKSPETIRVWSQTFAKWLTPGAVGGKGKHRIYDESDLPTLYLVKEMADHHISFDEIALALANDEHHRRPLPAIAAEITPLPPDRALAIQARVTELESEVQRLRNADAQNQLLSKMVADKDAEIARLNREIGRLEAGKDSE